jgi:predicted MFS family arabinose efflux permease
MSTTTGPLHHRGFQLLVLGQTASFVGDAFYAVALPWYVLADGGSPLLLAAVLAAYGVPRTLLMAVGGHASDRWRPWTVMLGSDVARMIAVALLAIAAAHGPASATVLVPIAIVLGAGEGMFVPGSLAIVPSLLPDHELQAGNAISGGANELALLVGPALGGVLVAATGPAAAFWVDAATFALSAATLSGIRREMRSSASPQGAEVNEPDDLPIRTLRQLFRTERALQVILLITFAANLASGALAELALPALAHGPFHTSSTGYGVILAALSGGALVGTLLAGRLSDLKRPAIVASVAYLGVAVAMAVAPYLGGPIGAAIALAVLGLLNGFGNIIAITVFQRWAPASMLGRLMGLLMLASLGTFPISVAIGGFVVKALGPAAFFPIAGSAIALAVLVGLTQQAWRSFGARPLDRTPESAVPTAGR